MEKWTAKEVKEKGRLLLENQVKWFSDEITKEEYEKAIKDVFKEIDKEKERLENDMSKTDITEKMKNSLEIIRYNHDALQGYIDVANLIKDFANKIANAHKKLSSDNTTILRILDMVIASETRIEGHLEYNKLLNAIPKEAKEKIDKELAKEKDIDADIKELVSIEFLSGHFAKSFIPLFESPTLQYAVIDFCLFISDLLLSRYGVKTTLNMETGEGNENYKDARSHIAKVLAFSEREPKFKKTQVYATITKYQNLFGVLESQEYIDAKKGIANTIGQMLKENKTADDMLNECIQELFKQGWWFNDKDNKEQ